MIKLTMKLGLAGVVLTVCSFAAVAETAAGAAGHWEGKIQIPDHEMRIVVDLAAGPKNAWLGSMTVLGSTAVDVPLNGIAVSDKAVHFTADLPQHAAFEGSFSGDANTLSGTASNAEGSAPFQLTRTGDPIVKVPPPSSALPKTFEGSWQGSVETGGEVRRIGLQLTPAADGVAMATLIAIDKGNMGIPVATVTIDGPQLQLEARAVSGVYRGTLGAAGEISGEWVEGTHRVPLVFKRMPSAVEKPPKQ